MATKLATNSLAPGIGKGRPLMLGIVGDSGSGKSTLMRGLVALLGDRQITEICLDDYHLYDRTERARLGLTALDPAANNLGLMTNQLRCLRNGIPIFKPTYNHATGTFGPKEWSMPGDIIIVHGLFTLFSPELAELFDLSIYLNPEQELRLAWKIRRDTHKRGYKLEEVLRQIAERRPDALAFIEPQQARADLIVSFRRAYPGATDDILDAHLYRGTPARSPELMDWTASGLSYQRQPDWEYIKIPAKLEQDQALSLQQQWQGFAGIKLTQESELGVYQSDSDEWKRSCSLSLTQLLIAGCLLKERKATRLVA